MPGKPVYKSILRLMLAGFLTGMFCSAHAGPATPKNANNLTETTEANVAPMFDSLPFSREVVVGERLNLQIVPRDSDHTVPVLEARELPGGSVLTDNRDGSRSLLWKPGTKDIGEHRIVLTARDMRDPSLRSERVLVVKVISAVEQ